MNYSDHPLVKKYKKLDLVFDCGLIIIKTTRYFSQEQWVILFLSFSWINIKDTDSS